MRDSVDTLIEIVNLFSLFQVPVSKFLQRLVDAKGHIVALNFAEILEHHLEIVDNIMALDNGI